MSGLCWNWVVDGWLTEMNIVRLTESNKSASPGAHATVSLIIYAQIKKMSSFSFASLAHASLLFLGPANTSLHCNVNHCQYDTLIYTNNMFSLLPPDPCRTRRLLIVNRLFSHVLEIYFSNHSFTSHFASLSAIVCTNKETCVRLMKTSNFKHIQFGYMQAPGIHSIANTFQYVLKALRHVSLRKFHITGVSFYEHGQEYLPGYRVAHESARHDRVSNRKYAVHELDDLSKNMSVTIDHPVCNTTILDLKEYYSYHDENV